MGKTTQQYMYQNETQNNPYTYGEDRFEYFSLVCDSSISYYTYFTKNKRTNNFPFCKTSTLFFKTLILACLT